MSRIAITGAAGFLGAATVRAARAAGPEVTALVRDASRAPAGWAGDAGITVVARDLATAGAGDLRADLAGAGAVIHAAASMSGDDAAHEINTIRPTRSLIAALEGSEAGQGARLVLVSSFSVYGFSGIPEGTVLTEDSPLESRPAMRDAYARAKLTQEALSRAAAGQGLAVRILRPGAIYGPGHLLSGQLGILKGGKVICIGGAAQVPAIHVDHAAAALFPAATLPQAGTPEVFNLVDPDPPTQDEWIAAAGLRPLARLPLGLMTGVARILAVSGRILPPLARRIPTGLRPETLAARYRPLRYDAARARDTLGLAPARGFADSMAASREETR